MKTAFRVCVLIVLVAALLAALRIEGFISWPWVWVASPIWISATIFSCVILFCVAVDVIADS